MTERLPIDATLPALIAALGAHGCAVLQAPPGAGKTTRVPLAMLEAGLTGGGRIVMLEPRRLATRAAAERMAQTLGEKVGETVGYRIRGEARVSKAIRIEVVIEGILTRMIQSDPELPGIAALIFDEFHERSLNADLGLALAIEARATLREDLALVVMSATLDAAPVAALLGEEPLITAQGRSFPVETRWLARPAPKTRRFEAGVADLVRRAVAESEGGVLVFLPGEGEIRRVAGMLADLPDGCVVRPLYGAMPFAAQRAAIAPMAEGRKIVLATAIAETALTIEDIRVVVDGGRARRARFDAGAGMSRLVTERVTRAEAEQRRGRAGRVAAGLCYRFWTRGEEGGLRAYPPAEIEAADLTGFALELAQWGVGNGEDLVLLTPPNPGAMAQARALLAMLGALNEDGRISGHGRALAGLPLHPRLGHMLLTCGPQAAPLAALLADRDPLRGASCDLGLRLDALADPGAFRTGRPFETDQGSLYRIRTEAKRLARGLAPQPRRFSGAEMVALAYPDRIGLRRKGTAPRWVLSGGKGAVMAAEDPLAGSRLLVACDLDGDAREARIRLAAAISEADLRGLFADRIVWHEVCHWSRRERQVVARRQERLGALVLSDQHWREAGTEEQALAMLDGVRDLGLGLNRAARLLQSRVELVRGGGAPLPDFSDAGLLARARDWLLPHLEGVKSAAQFQALELSGALRQSLSWEQMETLERLAPAHFTTPLGQRTAIDYGPDEPEISLRLQEMFGVTRHPTVGPQHVPLRVTLLSPARRPLQTTTDIAGFWASSYKDVRKEMRGRYPRHPWPEDPTRAAPTLRAKPRGK